MKLEIDTINDSIDELNKSITLIQEAIERRTGMTPSGKRYPLKPSEFRTEPKVIFEEIGEDVPKKAKIPVPSADSKRQEVKKRKVLTQDEHIKKEEEEDEDRYLPNIQYKDFW